MGVRWEKLNQEDQFQWDSLVSERRLEQFQTDINHLASLNDTLEKVWSWLLSGPQAWGAVLDRRRLVSRIKSYINEIESYGKQLQNKAEYRLSNGRKDHMSWTSFPKYTDKYGPLRNKAFTELRRSEKWLRSD